MFPASEKANAESGKATPSKSSFGLPYITLQELTAATDTATNAAAKVFAVPEIVEGILTQVDMKRLFTVQRVCTTFRDIINQSKQLRRIMWLDNADDKKLDDAALNPVCHNRSRKGTLYPLDVSIGGFNPHKDEAGETIGYDCCLGAGLRVKNIHSTDLDRYSYRKQGSWRGTKVFSHTWPIRLETSPPIWKPKDLLLLPGATLGDLADLVDCEVNRVLKHGVMR